MTVFPEGKNLPKPCEVSSRTGERLLHRLDRRRVAKSLDKATLRFGLLLQLCHHLIQDIFLQGNHKKRRIMNAEAQR
jgi:hypothetical protein